MKALIVDDNAADRKILRYIMEKHGFEATEAADGEEGLALAARHHPAIIVSDALMPRMDGFQFLRRVKSDPGLADIPFLFYSSVYTGCRDEQLALALGADAFVVKPKAPEVFWAEVSAILSRDRTRGSLIRPELLAEEEEYIREYSHIVTAKIEEKVAELERANAAIRQQAKSYRNLYDSMRDVVIVTDTERTILDANQPALRETFGYETGDVVRRDERLFYADTEGFLKAGAALPPTGGSDSGGPLEVSLRKKGGEHFTGELWALRRLDEEGVPSGNLVIMRD
ncbi:MAG TPA: response regulator, partial [Geobacteraceae bacterium]